MKTIRTLSISALLLGALWAAAPFAHAKNSLICTIVDETDKPVAKQEFILTTVGQAKEKEWKKKTDDTGKVEFKGLDDGSYQVRGELQGYVAGKSEPMEVAGNTDKPCKYTIVTAQFANAKLQEVMQLVQQKKIPEAQAQGKKLIEMMPSEGVAHYVLAVAYAYAGDQQAIPEVKKAAELSPDKFQDKVQPIQMQVLNQEAEVARNKNDYTTAIKKYEEMLAASPNESTVYYNMAVTYGRAQDYNKAIENIDKALALKPDDAEAKQLKIRLQDLYLKEMDKKLEKK